MKEMNNNEIEAYVSMTKYMTAVNPLLTHWSYCSFALSHRYDGLKSWLLIGYFLTKNLQHEWLKSLYLLMYIIVRINKHNLTNVIIR